MSIHKYKNNLGFLCLSMLVTLAASSCSFAQGNTSLQSKTPMPLTTQQQATGIFFVNDYITDRTSPAENTKGILKAIEAAKAWGSGATVQLGKGEYRLGHVAEQSDYIINIENTNDLTIKGMGYATKLVMTEPSKGGFMMAFCINVTVRDLVVDYDPVPFSQGTITKVDEDAGTFNMKIQEGYPLFSDTFMQEPPKPYGRFGLFMDPVKRQIKTGAHDFVFIDTWNKIGDTDQWEVIVGENQANKLAEIEPGDRYVQLARYGHAAVFFNRSETCHLINVTVHTGPGVSIGSCEASDIHLDNYALRFPEGSDRLLTTTADGMHMQANIIGPTVENSYFEGQADDAINMYHFPNYLAKVINENVIEVNFGNSIFPGDDITFYNAQTGKIVANAIVTEVKKLGNADFDPKVLTLDRAVSGLTPGENHQEADTLYNNTRCGAGFKIRNNIFRDHRRFAMMVKAPNGLIEGNVISNVGGYAMVVGNAPDWPEGAMPNNITIRNNFIIGCGHSKFYANGEKAAAIQVATKGLMGAISKDIGVHTIEISNNTIINPPGAGFFVGSVRDVNMTNNTVIYDKIGYKRSPGAAVRIDNVQNLKIDGLTVTSTDSQIDKAIEDFAKVKISNYTTNSVNFTHQ